jgi:peptidoglycan LD-endopeptidase LytH
VRISVRFSLVRRVLLAAAAVALLTPPSAAGAASDPLAAAVARVTAAQKADNLATAEFDGAQTRYFQLQDDQASTRHSITSLTGEQTRLAKLARLRAVVAYKRGGLVIDDLFGSGADILDAARRATMLDDINARGNDAIAKLSIVTSELHARESVLRSQISDSQSALETMRARERETERLLAEAGKAEADLRVRLAAEHRQKELATILATARAQASNRSAGASSGGGRAGQIIVSGNWVCPVQGPVSFTDTYGSPRGGGRTHKGNDLFSPGGTPLVAVTNGSVFFQSDPLGGLAAYVNGGGNTYYYAHLSDYVGGARSVSAGELIGHVGNTGDASGGPTHLHFEIRPGGPNGRGIDPYNTLAAHC